MEGQFPARRASGFSAPEAFFLRRRGDLGTRLDALGAAQLAAFVARP